MNGQKFERERRFTKISREMVRKTGEIVGGQVLENAKSINKLHTSVDLMRQEITALRNERSEGETRKTETR